MPRYVTEIYEFSGHQECPVGGEYIQVTNGDWINKNITEGVSTVIKSVTGDTVTVGSVAADRFETPGLVFKPGDFFIVTTPDDQPWILQNSDMPIIEVECRRCGFSYPKKKLVKGLCSSCVDKSI